VYDMKFGVPEKDDPRFVEFCERNGFCQQEGPGGVAYAVVARTWHRMTPDEADRVLREFFECFVVARLPSP